MVGYPIKVSIAAGVILAAFGAGWYVQGLRWDADVLDIRIQAAQHVIDAQQAAALELATKSAAIAMIDRAALAEQKELENENDALRSAVDSGAVRLRLVSQELQRARATAKSGGASVDDARTGELDPVARRAYFALRSALDRQYVELKACLETVRKLQ